MKEFKFKISGQDYTATVEENGASLQVTVNGKAYQVEVPETKAAVRPVAAPVAAPAAPKAAPAPAAPKAAAGAKVIEAPLPGTITKMLVKPGQAVSAGEIVCTMEAMKMENNITAESAGTVKTILADAGAQVQSGQAIIELA